MKLVILHCGHPKTGTSSLQKYLATNSDRLRAHGVYYPVLRPPGREAPPLPWVGYQHGHAMKLAGKGPGWTKPKVELDRLTRAMATVPHEVLLLSGEYMFHALFYQRIPRIWRYFREQGYRIRTLTYLRDQPERLSSAYAQQCKMGRVFMSFDEYCKRKTWVAGEDTGGEKVDDFGGAVYYDRLLDKDLHGWGRHSFRPFNAEVKARGVEADFMATLREMLAEEHLAAGLTEAEAAGLDQPPRSNEADGVILVALCRALNARFFAMFPQAAERRPLEPEIYLAATMALGELAIGDPRFSALTPERSARLRAKFAESNERFAREVWGRGWDDVFPPPDPARLVSSDLDDTRDPALQAQFEAALVLAERNFLEAVGWAYKGGGLA